MPRYPLVSKPGALLCGLALITPACAPRSDTHKPDHAHPHEHGAGHGHAHGHDHGHGAAHDHDGDHTHGEGGDHVHRGGHHRFEDAEQWAKEFDSPKRAEWQKPDEVVASFGLRPNAVVADVGAGTGYFTIRFARAVPQGRVFAEDIEPDMVRYIAERSKREGLSNITGVLGDPGDPRLPGVVDLAFLCNVYHHLPDIESFFQGLAPRLTSSGRVAIVDFKPDAPEDAPGPPKAMRVAPEEVVKRMAAAGYTLERRDDALLPYQYILVFTRAG